jgi:hypothetical protein
MNKMLTTGIIAGSLLGATGIVMLVQDKRTQRSIMQGGRKLMNKATDAIDDITNMVK